MMLTNDQVAAYAAQSIAAMDQQNKVAAANSPYTTRLNNLTASLVGHDNLPLNFKVYETREVNAFACPDGSVRVYTGLMDLMDDQELLGIIGHEVGHVALQHSKQAMQQQIINSAIAEVIASSGTVGAVLNSAQLLQLGNSMVSAKFSRKEENQADDYAYDFLSGSKVNPYSLVTAFEKIQKLENSSNASSASYYSKMFSSHPETKERIKHITDRCKADGYTR